MSENPSGELLRPFLHQLMGGVRRSRPAGPDAWQEIDAAAGAPTPADFRAFVDCYGGAILLDHLFIPHPDDGSRLAEFIEEERRYFLSGLEFLDDIPPRVVEHRDRMIPWAYHNWDGDVCLLVPSEDLQDWDVAVSYRQCPEIEIFDGGFTGFLAGVLKKRNVPRGWPIWEEVWKELRDGPLGL
ncbi:hypothetical protein ACXNSR_00135 [Streptomyces sp. NC-S4]